MLELRNITKDYKVADDKVRALKGVSIAFRKSEFVSVLGPSGCGKTTLLNIIGGLDHCTSGELVINGISTETYKDRDWDTYRNHSIGFVFQSYNLIPHQTILENVELALNIAGMKKAERVAKAKEALNKVGLEGLYKKKPNQLSGGQMQRVAIARALVGDPEILLADEPTGALDSETSVQIMDLIQEISRERLVIMVTHNPELAERYSTRIVRLLDGEIVDDTMPYTPEEEPEQPEQAEQTEQSEQPEQAEQSEQPEQPEQVEQVEQTEQPEQVEKAGGAGEGSGKQQGKAPASRKSKLSFWSAFRLSARNLMSKFKRTLLVCFAGSIGIIGVTTVLAVSTGVNNFIYDMQNDMLSGNPIQVMENGLDLTGITDMMDNASKGAAVKQSVVNGKVNVNYMIKFLADRQNDMNELFYNNDITEELVKYIKQMPSKDYAAIELMYNVGLGNNIYTNYNFENNPNAMASFAAAENIYTSVLAATDYGQFSDYISMVANKFNQAPETKNFVLSQYDIISPAETSKYPTEKDELMLVVDKDTRLTDILLAQLGYYSQEQFLNIAYKAKDSESYDPALDKDRFTYEELLNGVDGQKKFVYYPNNTVYYPTGTPTSPFGYHPFADESWDTGMELKITAILRPKSGLNYGCLKTGVYYTSALARYAIETSRHSEIVDYIVDNIGDDGSLDGVWVMDKNGNVRVTGTGVQYTYDFWYDGIKNPVRVKQDNGDYITVSQTDPRIAVLGTTEQMSAIMSMFMGGGGSSSKTSQFSLSLRALGGCTNQNGYPIPTAINIYPVNFEHKDNVTNYIKRWNSNATLTIDGEEVPATAPCREKELTYSDNMALVISIIGDMIDIITYALVAFTALSLVVSTIMIAIITYVSVIERIKEIGVIRSLGGRKRDVSRLFTAETFIIGLISGLIGVFVTFLLTIIINSIINKYAGIATIATLTAPITLIMIGISIVLTLISGLIPARLAAKKDPVVALRSE